jgi:hypothetical protein
VFAAIIKEDIAMEHTSTRCKINNTRITKNTSDLILFIIEEDPDTMDLQIWYNIAKS